MPDSLTTLFLPESPSPSYASDERELRVINRLRNMFTTARDHKRSRYDTWVRNYRLVNNRQSGAQANSTWMPAPRDSEIYPGPSSLVAWMTDQEIDIDLIPSYDPNSQLYSYVSKIADDLNDVIYTNWQVENYDAQIKLSIWDSLQFSNGILKAVWDNSLCDGYGNAVIRRVDPWSFYPDPNATSIHDSEYFIEARRMSYEEIERRFPESAHKIRRGGGSTDDIDERPQIFGEGPPRKAKTNPGQLPSSGQWPGSNSAIGRWAKPNSDRLTEPSSSHVVYECWVRQNRDEEIEYSDGDTDKIYESYWRLIVFCENAILLDCDAEELYSNGQHPYEMFTFDDIGDFYGIALVDHLAYPQMYLNRLLTALQHNAELTGNPIWMEAANAGLSRIGVINRPGQRLTMNSNAMAQNGGAKWLEPPAMPVQVMELVKFWIDRIENTLGLTALQKGHTPTQRNAEGSLNMVQEAAFVRVRSAMSNLQFCLQRLMTKVCDLVIDNYTDNRIMAIIGKDGEMVSKFLAGNHFSIPGHDDATPLKYIIRIEAGANGPTSRAARIAESDKLYALGAVDDEYLLQKHRVRNYPDVIKRLYDKRSRGIIGTPGQRSATRKQ